MGLIELQQVYLAMEAREVGAEVKALGLVSEYIKKFRFIHFTMHPSDIPGEAPGKGSNSAWAALKLSERYSVDERRDVIITGIDGLSLHSIVKMCRSADIAIPQPIATSPRITPH
mgnify:CR=1 FL=1